MAANLTCPMCGHSINLAEPPGGAEMRCPACFSLFPIKPGAASPLMARSTATAQAPTPAAVNRTVLAQTETMIRYTCPRCKKSLESPASFAGQKLNCPDCNQRLQIPQAPPPAAAPALNKTILATGEPAASPSVPTSRPSNSPVPVPKIEVAQEMPITLEPMPSARSESCLECGLDITRRARVQTCPDCGSLFCSAACYREHQHHAHSRKEKKRSRPVECDRCGSTEPPYARTQISQAGWITFALLMVFFFPLFWIGLLMTETEWRCRDCGARLD